MRQLSPNKLQKCKNNLRVSESKNSVRCLKRLRQEKAGLLTRLYSLHVPTASIHTCTQTRTHKHSSTFFFLALVVKSRDSTTSHWPPASNERASWSLAHASVAHTGIYMTLRTICLITASPVPSQASYLIRSLSSCNPCYLIHTHSTLCATLSLHIAPCQPLCCVI